MNQRGFTLIELLVAALVAGIILMAVFSLYVATRNSFAQSDSQMELQRQGTLALEEIARQIRSATAIDTGCAGLLRVLNPNGTFCYRAGTGANNAGALCQDSGAGCRDLLAGLQTGAGFTRGLSRIALLRQPNPADPRCPPVAAGQFCLTLAPVGANAANVAFAITDGINVTTFTATVMRRN